ncbi:MAG: PEGA domain-containing protein, partial [Polyangiaceae bacterium]|nr:PEGA domain-containing protein [Polyangiaceae bacterium]
PSRSEEATAIRPRPVVQTGGGSKAGVILGGLALVVVLAMAVFLFLPKKGGLTVDIKTPTGASVAKAEVFIDGQKRCDTVPCVVRDLDAGSKTVKVIAPDFPPRDAVEIVEGGKEKLVMITLEGSSGPAPSGTPSSSGATGFKAASAQQGVKVFVDGAEKGTLPVELTLAPGAHKVRFEGGERFEKLEQTVDVAAGQVKDLGPLKLKVLKGQVTLDLVTEGANVSLVREDGKKTEKKLPASVWKSPPVKIDIDASEKWKLVAEKKGFDDFSQEISFEDGQAEKTIRIELTEKGKGPPAVAVGAIDQPSGGDKPAPAVGGDKPAPTGGGDKPAPAAGGGTGTLNINSIPVSKVVLDGRPLGSTPKVGVSVPAGSHTVTFIHPDFPKKSVTVQVKAGETKTAAVKFK